MTIAGNKDGTISLILNHEETKAFKAGKAVIKESGDAKGAFQAIAKIIRRPVSQSSVFMWRPGCPAADD
jgi:hypothetical protein